MRTIKLALFALAATLTFGAANADEADKMDVIVVTAARPDPVESPKLAAVEQAKPTIDFTELTIEMPSLDRKDIELEASRIELALREAPNPQS